MFDETPPRGAAAAAWLQCRFRVKAEARGEVSVRSPALYLVDDAEDTCGARCGRLPPLKMPPRVATALGSVSRVSVRYGFILGVPIAVIV